MYAMISLFLLPPQLAIAAKTAPFDRSRSMKISGKTNFDKLNCRCLTTNKIINNTCYDLRQFTFENNNLTLNII